MKVHSSVFLKDRKMCMAKCVAALVAGNVMIDWCMEEYLTICISFMCTL